ncbi:MAG: DUF72 domain-containing protein [Cyanothece sp. SIO2G6]|nr:DUF72 domain-containing protein [Cyanothece sp. SIO2G6]
MGFAMGCAIWAYQPWVGEFYPAGSRAKDFLALYGDRFTAVEGNTTFYSVPSAATIKRWAHDTSPSFKFCLKLPKTVTHDGALVPKLPTALTFLQRVQPLESRLGPILIQLPPSYAPHYFEDLAAFLTQFPRTDYPVAVEVRHIDWFTPMMADKLNHCLTSLGVGRVLLDSRPIYQCQDDPQLQSERRKPQVPLQPVITAPFSLIRYISHPDLPQNQPYLAEWVEQIAQWYRQAQRVQALDLYFFVHCPVEERSPHIARHFQSLLETAGLEIPPLPWNQLDSPPAQLSLF